MTSFLANVLTLDYLFDKIAKLKHWVFNSMLRQGKIKTFTVNSRTHWLDLMKNLTKRTLNCNTLVKSKCNMS